MSKLTLVLAESALETIPREIWELPAVKKHVARRGKKPGEILLDRTYHHSAMLCLKHASKRGRPDIVHLSLLEALGSLLNKERLLDVYVHTFDDYIISIDPSVRLPRNYNRFVGLMEQLFKAGRVPAEGKSLLTLEKASLSDLLAKIRPTRSVLLTPHGKPKLLSEVIEGLSSEKRPVVIIGGFARGDFSKSTLEVADELVCIDPEPLDAWIIVSVVLHEFERILGIPEKRMKRLLSSAAAGIRTRDYQLGRLVS